MNKYHRLAVSLWISSSGSKSFLYYAAINLFSAKLFTLRAQVSAHYIYLFGRSFLFWAVYKWGGMQVKHWVIKGNSRIHSHQLARYKCREIKESFNMSKCQCSEVLQTLVSIYFPFLTPCVGILLYHTRGFFCFVFLTDFSQPQSSILHTWTPSQHLVFPSMLVLKASGVSPQIYHSFTLPCASV